MTLFRQGRLHLFGAYQPPGDQPLADQRALGQDPVQTVLIQVAPLHQNFAQFFIIELISQTIIDHLNREFAVVRHKDEDIGNGIVAPGGR